ncbi:MAG TPA: indole-3-glycerol-phosphate synthase [Holophagaceae bacterium]|nr:indole-3-glycerol-phosphate synthase [Holophagaceae bacterium]
MILLPDPIQLVKDAELPAGSHLQRVVASELVRALQLQVMPLTDRRPRSASEAGPFEGALRASLRQRGAAVIAEYKQGSPSLGPFALGTPLQRQLRFYKDGGAACFSILTEPAWFYGETSHLEAAADLGVPRLYKGFVISEVQLREAAATGAEAVLLIARVLKGHTAAFAEAARAYGLEPLVELHDLTEIPLAQAAQARLVGINARDLATFTLGAPTAAPLRAAFPEAVLIRESGLATPEDARRALEAGFDAVLIGEALMRSLNPRNFLDRLFGSLQKEAV